MTTHSMKEAEEVCNRVLILDKGQTMAIGPVQNLIKESKIEGLKISLNIEIGNFLNLEELKEEVKSCLGDFALFKKLEQRENEILVFLTEIRRKNISEILNRIGELLKGGAN